MIVEMLKKKKQIDDLAEHIAKQQLDLGKQFIVTNLHGNNKNTITLPQGEQLNFWDWNKVADEIATVNEDMSCKHEWVNVGFHFDKWVCKKCDVNKGSNE